MTPIPSMAFLPTRGRDLLRGLRHTPPPEESFEAMKIATEECRRRGWGWQDVAVRGGRRGRYEVTFRSSTPEESVAVIKIDVPDRAVRRASRRLTPRY
jgi:hypothetical protein